MQLYESISLTNAWWNICCSACGKPIIADGSWRNVKITWSEVLGIAIDLWGKPDGFFVRDFLISMEFLGGAVVLTFCSQGSRRGEVQISVPAEDEEASGLLKAFLDEMRVRIEAKPTPLELEREDYFDDEYEVEEELLF